MKIRRVLVTPELIVELLTVGHVIDRRITVTDGLPAGSVLTGIGYDVNSRSWAFDFFHESFEELQPGFLPLNEPIRFESTELLQTASFV